MNTTTILDRDQILNLCELIHTSHSGNLPVAGSRVLGLFRCIQVTLLTLRHNLTQELLADIHTVSQATISRVITVYTPLIAEALQAWVPGTGDLDPDRQYIIDGTLAPCWSWREHPELYTGHCVDAQTRSHPGIAGRHPHSFPSHHLESGGGLHSLDRRPPPSLGAQCGGP